MCASFWVLHLYHGELGFHYPIIMCVKEREHLMTGWSLILVSHCLRFTLFLSFQHALLWLCHHMDLCLKKNVFQHSCPIIQSITFIEPADVIPVLSVI